TLIFSALFFQAEDGIRDRNVTGVQTCALPIFLFVGEEKVELQESSLYIAILFCRGNSVLLRSLPKENLIFCRLFFTKQTLDSFRDRIRIAGRQTVTALLQQKIKDEYSGFGFKRIFRKGFKLSYILCIEIM